MELPNWSWLALKLSNDWDFGDIIRWYGEDTYGNPNLFGVWEGSIKSVGDKISVYPYFDDFPFFWKYSTCI